MTADSLLKQDIVEHLQSSFKEKDSAVTVQIKRNGLGWFNLRIISSLFEHLQLPEREKVVDEILEAVSLNLGNFPFANYQLLTPNEESQVVLETPIQLPLWSEILMAPEPEYDKQIEEGFGKKPLLVTFYSFKGGVGRTTALTFVANILALRGKRVVVVDFDLEAPGLSFLLPTLSDNSNLGLLDFLHQRCLTPELDVPTITECVRQVQFDARGELYLVPAGEYDENYIHRLADLDVQLFYRRDSNPIHQFFKDLKEELDPDVILIDARTGFNEMGAVALFDQADLGVICFSPTSQSFAGLQWVIQAANKQRKYQGLPDLRFLVTPVPPVAQVQQQAWMAQTFEWIAQNWDMPSSLTVEEICYPIPYNPNISTLGALSDNLPAGLLDPYASIADAIFASLAESQELSDTEIANKLDDAINEIQFRAATAHEMEAHEIPHIFQKTGDFPKFLNDRTWLVRGAKGTGKSLLFRLFVERPDDAVRFAETETNLKEVLFVPGHGQAKLNGTILTSTELGSYESQVGYGSWPIFWLNYAILQLSRGLYTRAMLQGGLAAFTQDPELQKLYTTSDPNRAAVVNWLVGRAKITAHQSQATDELLALDNLLRQKSAKAWILYDELDIGFSMDNERRRRALEALFSWWVEIASSLSSITPKILLREDIYNDLNFTNKAHFSGRYVQLRWEDADLWRLVIRQVLNSSKTLKEFLATKYGITAERLNSIGNEQLRQSLYPIWGERMGRGNKAYTHNWIRNRISDSNGIQFPRSLMQLLQRAVEIERNTTERNPYNSIVRPRSLIEAVPSVSEERVAEVRNEYPEFDDLLTRLNGERSPITRERLSEIWSLPEDKLSARIIDMIKAGIMKEYLRQPDLDTSRYSIAELYLYGLGMTRLGQR